MLSLADVLELPVVRRALPELVTGTPDRELRWAHVIEMPDPDDLLKGGELVLTTGLGAGADAGHQSDWIGSLIRQGIAALAIELGTSWREVPDVVLRACERAGVPVVAFHRAVRFVEITEAVHGAVLHAQFDLLRRGEEIHRRFTELILQGRGAPEILAELAAAVGNPVLLEDAAGSLVYYVSGPLGDDLALAAWTDARRAEARGEEPEGMLAVDVRLMGGSWGRLMALALDDPLDEFDRVAVERAALAVAIDLLGQQHDEQLRARSRGAFLSDLADGRVEEADARRRAEALGFSGTGRGALLPLVASWRAPAYGRSRGGDRRGSEPLTGAFTWTRLSGDLRTALSSTGFGVLLGPRDADVLILLSLGARGYDAALAEHVAHLFHGALDRHGLGPADAALAIGGPAASWSAAGEALRRVRRSAGAATALPVVRWHDARRPGVADLLHDLRDTPELEAFVDEQIGPLLEDGSVRTRALLETLEAYLAAGGRKAEAARALHLERQSLYLRLRRIEELLGVSLDDEDVVLGLHLAVRARRFRRGAPPGAGPR
ncbi:PucR family transcriptional regulator [Candidatus Solirubrobacter pratensis]|uniref:PucR family transcriptional regulator n=1 Tax=Candidatus Solirubrobacter pratensis TaxID=1298857 RepID=UPI0004152EAF|nr:PucR family transcriptional regulator [Candidatus Solirubrobacter pratensis]